MSGKLLPHIQGEPIACPDCDTLHTCGPVQPGHDVRCRACGRTLFSRSQGGIDHCLAFSLAALVLFIPANLYPIVTFAFHGVDTQNILLTGAIRLYQGGLPAVGILVGLTSIVFPCLLLLGLIYVCLCSRLGQYPEDFAFSLRMTCKLVRWAMIDVYLLACLVAFIKLGQLATVIPGTGLYCLGASLACTMVAGMAFDPDLLWHRYGARSMHAGSWNLLSRSQTR